MIDFLSRHSLGIYALHKFFWYFVALQLSPVFILVNLRKKMPVGELMVNFQTLSIALLTILLTFLSVYVLGKTPLERYIK